MREGDTGATMFLIIEGRVSVQLALPDGTDARIYDLGLGEIFGHMSALTGARRFATVRADWPAAGSMDTEFSVPRPTPRNP